MSAAYTALVLAHNPIGYWPMTDLTAAVGATLTAAAPSGQVSDSESLVVGGPANGAKSLTGFQTMPYSAAIPSLAGLTTLTFEAWVVPRATGMVMMQKGGIKIATRATGLPYWEVTTNEGATWIDSSISADVDARHHLVGVTDGATHKIYLDGVLQGSVSWGNAIVDGNDPLYIGGFPGVSLLSGIIDEVAVYDHALSSEQILAHYNIGTTEVPQNLGSLFDEIMADGPVTFIRSIDPSYTGSGGTVAGAGIDASGNGNHLDAWNNGAGGLGYPQNDVSGIISAPDNPSWKQVRGSNLWRASGYSEYDFTTGVTLSFWVKADALVANNNHDLVRKGDLWGLTIDQYTHRIRAMAVSNPYFLMTNIAGPVMLLGQWYHMGLTFDGITLNLYVNGVLEGTQGGGSGAVMTSAVNLAVGEYSSDDTAWDGSFDELAIFDYALTPERMLAHYQAGIAVVVDEEDPPVNLTAPVISGTPVVGSTLTCSDGIWEGDNISYVYQWMRSGSEALTGDMYLDKQSGKIYQFDGTDWQLVMQLAT